MGKSSVRCSRMNESRRQTERENRAKEVLARLDGKLKLVEDLVIRVADGLEHGFYLHGEGGIGKSHLVFNTLDREGFPYHTFNSRMTAKGLFRTLQRHPDAVVVLEDMERLTNDKDAQGVLRSALSATQGKSRIVTWITADDPEEFEFRGGLIMTANRPLADLPELRAVESRIAVLRFEVTQEELQAQIRRIASGGFPHGNRTLDASPCTAIAEHVISMCREAGASLNIRLFEKGCKAFLQWEAGRSHTHWHDMVRSDIRQALTELQHAQRPLSRRGRLDHHRQIAREIMDTTTDRNERLRMWGARTNGLKKSAFYDRCREVRAQRQAEGPKPPVA